MIRTLRFCFVIALIVSPEMCLSWTESKHPISELLIQTVYLDTNYVFCGCDAYWGTNAFGLFVFDRKREAWMNYPQPRRVKSVQREGDFVYVAFHKGSTFRFSPQDGLLEEIAKREAESMKGFHLTVGGMHYRFHRDSVIAGAAPNLEVYRPSSEAIPGPAGIQPASEELSPIFGHPVAYQNKIYMPYDLGLGVTTTWTSGVAVFDVSEKTFGFYGSDIFKGTVTGAFVQDSLIIFPTARYQHEGNAGAAAGLVAFSPTDSTFSPWKELPLPDEPLAIFRVAQDEKEYWIGTDKGVFRIDKETQKTTHYQMIKGIVSKDSTTVHYSCGDFERNSSPVAARLNKHEELGLLGVRNGWCEIEGPWDTTGWVEPEYVEGVLLQNNTDGRSITSVVFKMGRMIPVRVSDSSDGELLLTLDPLSLSEGHQYEVLGKSGEANHVTRYKIKLATAWINMDDLIFRLGEVE